jgi:type IV pilus assembly protein PilP
MELMSKIRLLRNLAPVFAILMVAGCSGDMDDLQIYIDEVRARSGGRVEPLPQIKPYESFVYNADSLRSPFLPDAKPNGPLSSSGPSPVANRNKEYLEQYPLDTLSMVGTLVRGGQTFGLVQTRDGLVHRVLTGNYLGQNDGRVVGVQDAQIKVEELVPNGVGGFFKRNAAISLD